MDGGVFDKFVSGFLWADADWLEMRDGGFTYWPGRLAQHFTADHAAEGKVKWRLDCPVVGGVTDAALAAEVCLALNELSAGWSFAYRPETRSIHALAAMCAPLGWDRFVIRFAQAAKLCGWFCDLVAEGLADALGGTPLFSSPETQAEPRLTYDAVVYLPTAMRERCEWVVDPVPFRYPDVQETADYFAVGMGQMAHRVQVTDEELRIATMDTSGQLVGNEVVAGFDMHPLLGAAWRSDLVLPQIPAAACPAAASQAAWWMFDDAAASLMGGWIRVDGELKLRQWTTTPELRWYEQSARTNRSLSLAPRPELEYLWGVASTLTDGVRWALEAPVQQFGQPQPQPQAPEAVVSAALQGLTEYAEEGVGRAEPHPDAAADRGLLWLLPGPTLIVVGWFNPVGPTLSTLELRTAPISGRTYVVEYMRHPFAPRFTVVGEADSAENLQAAVRAGVDQMMTGSLPNFASIDFCPEDLAPLVMDQLRPAAERVVFEGGPGFEDVRSSILATLGDPWAYAGGPASDGKSRDVPAPASDDAFAEWFAAVTLAENYAANVVALPNAWDGALNYQSSQGNIARGLFDTGPLTLTYTDIGRVPPEPGPRLF